MPQNRRGKQLFLNMPKPYGVFRKESGDLFFIRENVFFPHTKSYEAFKNEIVVNFIVYIEAGGFHKLCRKEQVAVNARSLADKRMIRAGADKTRVAFGKFFRNAVAFVSDFARGNIKELEKFVRVLVFVLRGGQLRGERKQHRLYYERFGTIFSHTGILAQKRHIVNKKTNTEQKMNKHRYLSKSLLMIKYR